MSKAEKLVLFFFGLTALGWIFRPLIAKATGPAISDTGIAMFVALMLFIVPVDSKKDVRILSWDDTKKLPWGVLLLFGGGLALAGLIQKSGLNVAAIGLILLLILTTVPVVFNL